MPLELNCQEQEYYPVVVIQLISLTPVASLDYQTRFTSIVRVDEREYPWRSVRRAHVGSER